MTMIKDTVEESLFNVTKVELVNCIIFYYINWKNMDTFRGFPLEGRY